MEAHMSEDARQDREGETEEEAAEREQAAQEGRLGQTEEEEAQDGDD
jgi:hypothetical protein